MSLNKIITSVNALSNNIIIPDNELNNVVCIDTNNNRIGVKNSNPIYEIDVNGVIKTNNIYINNSNNDLYDISSDKTISIGNSLLIKKDISCNYLQSNQIINTLYTSDASFIGNINFVGIVNIDGSLNVSNNVSANFFNITSDDRLKHNEIIINNGLNTIRQLQPQLYQKTLKMKDEDYHGPINEPYVIEAGLIAQDVNLIDDLSFTVFRQTNGTYSVNYNNIFVYGLAAIKELDTIVNLHSLDISYITNKVDKIPINDISLLNISNVQNLIKNQNQLISILNNKISNLENRINILEKK